MASGLRMEASCEQYASWRTVWGPSQPAEKCGHALVMEQMLSNTLLVGPFLSLSLACNVSDLVIDSQTCGVVVARLQGLWQT